MPQSIHFISNLLLLLLWCWKMTVNFRITLHSTVLHAVWHNPKNMFHLKLCCVKYLWKSWIWGCATNGAPSIFVWIILLKYQNQTKSNARRVFTWVSACVCVCVRSTNYVRYTYHNKTERRPKFRYPNEIILNFNLFNSCSGILYNNKNIPWIVFQLKK